MLRRIASRLRTPDAIARTLAVVALAAATGCSDEPTSTGDSPPGDVPGADAEPPALADAGSDARADATDADANPFPPMTVHGQVVDRVSGSGVQALVQIGNLPAVRTDGSGTFRFDNVDATYDLTVVRTNADGAASVAIFQGLTRRDPRVPTSVRASSSQASSQAGTVTGTLSGAAFVSPQPSDTTSNVQLVSGSSAYNAYGYANYPSAGFTGAYSLTADWAGGPLASATLHAFQYGADAYGMPTSFLGYGTAAVSLSSGGSTSATLAMNTIGTGMISGSVRYPLGWSSIQRSLFVTIDRQTLLLSSDARSLPTYAFATPIVPGATFFTRITAKFPDGGEGVAYDDGLGASASGRNLVVPEKPILIAPADNTTGVSVGASMLWIPPTSGLDTTYRFSMVPRASLTAPWYEIFTTAKKAALPDLHALGVVLPRAADYLWWVNEYPAFASTDAVVSGAFSLLVSAAATESRHLTTAP